MIHFLRWAPPSHRWINTIFPPFVINCSIYINIPIINRSVIWWESQHQKASITLGGSSIDQAYLVPLFVSVAGFSLLFGALVLMRMRTALAEMRIEARMRRMADY